MFLIVIEVIIQVGLILFVGSQILIPMFNGTALFPGFRRRKVEVAIVDALEQEALKQRENVLASIRKRSQKHDDEGNTE